MKRDLDVKKMMKKLQDNYEFLREKSYKHGYTNLPKDFYHEFDVNSGDIVLFDAGLLHQGFVKGKEHIFHKMSKN